METLLGLMAIGSWIWSAVIAFKFRENYSGLEKFVIIFAYAGLALMIIGLGME